MDSLSVVTSSIPFRPVIGNHDEILGGEKYYEDYLYPSYLPSGSSSNFSYRLDFGNIHVFLLDVRWVRTDYSEDTHKWLETQFQNISKDDWIIIMSHCNVHGDFESNLFLETIQPLFINNDVDLVLSGHSHSQYIMNYSGICYCGCGKMKEADYSDHFDWYMQNNGYYQVKIAGNKANIEFKNHLNETISAYTIYG